MFLGYGLCAGGRLVLPPVTRRPRRFDPRLHARRSDDGRCRRGGASSRRAARSRVRRRADGSGSHTHRQHPLDRDHRPRRHDGDVARSRPPRRGGRLGSGSMARCARRGDRPPDPPAQLRDRVRCAEHTGDARIVDDAAGEATCPRPRRPDDGGRRARLRGRAWLSSEPGALQQAHVALCGWMEPRRARDVGIVDGAVVGNPSRERRRRRRPAAHALGR